MERSRREDYLVRQIKAVAAMLAAIAGLRLRDEHEEARAQLERAYDALLGTRGEMIRRVDPATAALLVGSTEGIQALADLHDEEAAQARDDGEAERLKARAAALRALSARSDRSG